MALYLLSFITSLLYGARSLVMIRQEVVKVQSLKSGRRECSVAHNPNQIFFNDLPKSKCCQSHKMVLYTESCEEAWSEPLYKL